MRKIIAYFKDGDKIYTICLYGDKKYHIEYDGTNADDIDTLEEARALLKKHRPNAVEVTLSYKEFKEQNSQELNNFIGKHFVFAFGQAQYEKKLKELGLTEEEFQEKYVGFLGGALPADKVDEYIAISKRASENLKTKLYNDFNFAKSAFRYELGNYECYFSYRWDEALGALGLKEQDLENNEHLMRAFKEAKSEYWAWCNENC